MTIPPWLAVRLDELLPERSGAERDAIAQSILDAVPLQPVVTAIAESARHVLAQRGIADDGGELSSELARNASMLVVESLWEAT